jgi:hypothetical protein
VSDDDLITPFFADFDDTGAEPPPPPAERRLIAEVAKLLKVERAECEAAIRVHFRAVRGRYECDKAARSPRDIKRVARSIGPSVRRLTAAMAKIHDFYAFLWLDHDPDLGYAQFVASLNKAVRMAAILDWLVVPDGSRQRDVTKHTARLAARYLVAKFCGDTPRTKNSAARLENAIARSFYMAATGRTAVDLTGDIEGLEPGPIELRRDFTRK